LTIDHGFLRNGQWSAVNGQWPTTSNGQWSAVNGQKTSKQWSMVGGQWSKNQQSMVGGQSSMAISPLPVTKYWQ
jgi:hypothetical protein